MAVAFTRKASAAEDVKHANLIASFINTYELKYRWRTQAEMDHYTKDGQKVFDHPENKNYDVIFTRYKKDRFTGDAEYTFYFKEEDYAMIFIIKWPE